MDCQHRTQRKLGLGAPSQTLGHVHVHSAIKQQAAQSSDKTPQAPDRCGSVGRGGVDDGGREKINRARKEVKEGEARLLRATSVMLGAALAPPQGGSNRWSRSSLFPYPQPFFLLRSLPSFWIAFFQVLWTFTIGQDLFGWFFGSIASCSFRKNKY